MRYIYLAWRWYHSYFFWNIQCLSFSRTIALSLDLCLSFSFFSFNSSCCHWCSSPFFFVYICPLNIHKNPILFFSLLLWLSSNKLVDNYMRVFMCLFVINEKSPTTSSFQSWILMMRVTAASALWLLSPYHV